MDLNKYLMGARDMDFPEELSYPVAKRITCADGFSLSVQANQGAYCSPRNNRGPWYEVEVGFPSSKPELIMDRAEDQEQPTETVYSYVDIKLVEQLIELHGGQAKEPA